MTESITPQPDPTREIRFQLSVPAAAATVPPEQQTPNGGQQPQKRGARRRLWFFAALSAFAGVVGVSALRSTDPITSRVHGGSLGYRKGSTGKDLHWEKKALTVYLDDSLEHLGPGASEAVMQAFGQWVASDTFGRDVGAIAARSPSLAMMLEPGARKRLLPRQSSAAPSRCGVVMPRPPALTSAGGELVRCQRSLGQGLA